ncbi:MAG: mucoidy inhibitor MuiA family protein [Bacteroidia bacterium]
MKKSSQTIFLFLVTCLFIHSTAHAQVERKIASKISSVQVYPNQAVISRIAMVDLQEGIQILSFDKLSPFINSESIEVKTDLATILSVGTKNDYMRTDEKPEYVLLLEDSLEKVNAALADFKAEKESIVLERDLMLANKQVGGTQIGVKADELEDLMMVYKKKLQEFKTNWFFYSKQEKVYNDLKVKLESQLQEYSQGVLSLNNQIMVTIKADKPLLAQKIEIRYLVNNASWTPYYDVRVKDHKSPMLFFLKAKIVQSTGEDWKNVSLQLNTANPSLGGIQPQLTPNVLRFKNNDVLMVKRLSFKDAAPAAPAVQMDDEGKVSSMQQWASVEQNAMSIEFVINNNYSIPSDNNAHQIDVTNVSAAAEYIYTVCPKLDKDVFVSAMVPAIDLISQLPGEANVYFDGTFTGKTHLQQGANDTLLISLGRDRRVIAERVRVKEMNSKSFFGGTKTEQSKYEIQIRNTRKEVIDIMVSDQIPISSEKEIEVKNIDLGGANWDASSGKLIWKIKLAAEESKKLSFAFEVKYPSDKQLQDY